MSRRFARFHECPTPSKIRYPSLDDARASYQRAVDNGLDVTAHYAYRCLCRAWHRTHRATGHRSPSIDLTIPEPTTALAEGAPTEGERLMDTNPGPLYELRQAESKIIRMRDKARSDQMPDHPWNTDHQGGLYLGGYGAQFAGPNGTIAAGMAELAASSVPVLTEVVLPIIQDAARVHPSYGFAFRNEQHWADDHEAAVRLARFVNEAAL